MAVNKTQEESVSVIITAYNCPEYCGEAIESILQQTAPPQEIIVVDDGSTDATSKIICSFEPAVRVIRQENQGSAAARNTGVKSSSGAFLAFLDCDDIWLPEKLEMQLSFFQTEPQLDAVFCRLRNFISPELSDQERQMFIGCEREYKGETPATVLIRRTAFERVGYFEPSLRRAEVVDWYTRAIDAGISIDCVTKVLYLRRLFRQPNTGEGGAEVKDYARALKAALDRRRGRSGAVR